MNFIKGKLNIILTILLVVAVFSGTTYAIVRWGSGDTDKTDVTFDISGIGTVSFSHGTNIVEDNLAPITNPEDEDALPFTITKKIENVAFANIILTPITLPNELKEESFKYSLYSSSNNDDFTLVTTGNFSDKTANVPFNIVENMPINSSFTYYKVVVYIDSTVENPLDMMGQTFECSISVSVNDQVPANKPLLTNNLIPVKYNGTDWVRADTTNLNNSWYDYDNSMWANAVMVKTSGTNTREYYLSDAALNQTINSNDILAFYVWIPRFKYKVWNINKTINIDSYNAKTTGIDIKFEYQDASTGDVSCSIDNVTKLETCTGTNGTSYYTHPAFTFGNEDLTGFWIGKFETTGTTSNPTILPSLSSVKNQSILNQYNTAMIFNNSTYVSDSSKIDAHILNNFEWGAVSYLTHSDYGRCDEGVCTEVTINNCSNYITGIGGNTVSASSSSSTCTNNNNKYNGTYGLTASTTGNISGVYDMSGGLKENVMGLTYANNNTNLLTGYSSSSTSGFAGVGYTNSYAALTGTALPDVKYYNAYAFGTTTNDQTAYSRSYLGDALGEVVTTDSIAWNSDSNFMPSYESSWITRGNYATATTNAGIFSSSSLTGASNNYNGFRIALVTR